MNQKTDYWLRIIVACIIYTMANVFDYFMTVYGIIIRGKEQEANPIIKSYMSYFGLQNGILIYKLLMCILIIIAVIVLDFIYNKKSKKPKPLYLSLYLLYIGSILAILAGFSWLI